MMHLERKGFTLIEVVVSIGIVGMLAAILLTVLSGNMKNIFSSGEKTRYIFQAQENIEKAIKNNGEDSNQEEYTLKLEFHDDNGEDFKCESDGIKIQVNLHDKNKNTISTYIPQ
jgi:prepilin-type N-terminal cleavage/methylation domain-containing protein